MPFTFQLRRDTSYRWSEENPVLKSGEPGVEIDTGQLKIGNGIQHWEDLPYFVPDNPEDEDATLPEHINSATPHPVYDDGPSLSLLYANAKV